MSTSEDSLKLDIKITAITSLASSGEEEAEVNNVSLNRVVLDEVLAEPKKGDRPRRNFQLINRKFNDQPEFTDIIKNLWKVNKILQIYIYRTVHFERIS